MIVTFTTAGEGFETLAATSREFFQLRRHKKATRWLAKHTFYAKLQLNEIHSVIR